MKELYEKVGAIHIHTIFSDGSGHFGEIIKAASEVGLEYLLFSDHRTLEPKRQNLEGFHDGVLVGIGYEINDHENLNHLLAFELDREVEDGVGAVEYTRRVVEEGGWAVVAHPDERRNRFPEFPAYPWTAWESQDFQAVEIWNYFSEWMERLTRWNKLWLYINPRRSVIAPTRWTLETWDRLNLKRRVIGIGGVDAHAHYHPLWRNVSVAIFPYKVAFRSIHMHVLLDEPPMQGNGGVALKQLFGSLRSGRAFVANRYVGQAHGFRFWAEDVNAGTVYQMGDRVRAGAQLLFCSSLPKDATHAVLLKDSQPICRWRGTQVSCPSSEPGVYRVEVRRGLRAFIYSNPIVIEA